MISAALKRATILTLAFLLVTPMALAQSQADEPDEVASTEELKKVAEIVPKIEKVREKYEKKIRNAKGPSKIVSYERQMVIEINRTIEQHEGMSVDRYEQITEAAQSDDKLKQKILRLSKKQEAQKVGTNKSR